jgi:hypothetical protein
MTAAGAGTTVRPIFGVLATTAVAPKLREIGLFNTTTTSCVYELVSISGGTPGATVTAYAQDLGAAATPIALAKQLWTADGTATKTGYRIVCGAAIGSGAILSFGDNGVRPALSATIGLGLVPVGTGQICEVYFVWDE